MSVTILKPDRTGAARARRYRKRRRLRAVTPAPRHARGRDAVTPIVTLSAALTLAAVSGGFSVIGLTTIFAGVTWPIIAMGCAFEFGKIAGVTWLGRPYAAPLALKFSIVALIVTLMALNAVGIYGFLAHAHIEHAVAGDVAISTLTADVNARMEIQAAVVADIDKRIAQVDAVVDEATKRGRSMGAMAAAEHQKRNRADLVADRLRASTALAALQVKAAQVEGERATAKADSGPVHYLAGLIGADDEAVMRWFILAIALMLDPLAVALLLAATRGAP